MALLTIPGAEHVLAAHGPALPQPDQLCGPFSACVALHAVLPDTDVPSLVTLATAAGTAIWPYDVAQWRPAGAPLDRTGWEELPQAVSDEASGTDAAGLIAGLGATVGERVCVVPVAGAESTAYALRTLLTALVHAPHPLGVVAHLRTGPIAPAGSGWDVGHFVVLCSIDPGRDEVTVGDTYAELTDARMPPGCRRVAINSLAEALATPPGRGLLLLVRTEDRAATRAMVTDAGLAIETWSA